MNKKIFFMIFACAVQLFSCMAYAQTEVQSTRESVSVLRSEPGEDETMRIESKKTPENNTNVPPMVIYPEINLPSGNYNQNNSPTYPSRPETWPHSQSRQ